jgi:Ni,Fe-hydrogenase I large subunit
VVLSPHENTLTSPAPSLEGLPADTAYQPSANAKAFHSYDECVALLAHAVGQHDEAQIDQVAELIGELAVVIEL